MPGYTQTNHSILKVLVTIDRGDIKDSSGVVYEGGRDDTVQVNMPSDSERY